MGPSKRRQVLIVLVTLFFLALAKPPSSIAAAHSVDGDFSVGGISPGITVGQAFAIDSNFLPCENSDLISFHERSWENRSWRIYRNDNTKIGIAVYKNNLVYSVGGPVLTCNFHQFQPLKAGDSISQVESYISSALWKNWECKSRSFTFESGPQRVCVYHDWKVITAFSLELLRRPDRSE